MPAEIHYDQLHEFIGRRFGPSAPLTVAQAMIDGFADITDDHQWVHVDVDRAAREMGGTIAHGYLTLSLIPHFTAELIEILGVGHGLNYGLNRVRFTSAVKAGAALTGVLTIVGVEAKGTGKMFTSEVALTAVGEERPACIAETLVLVFPGAGRLGEP